MSTESPRDWGGTICRPVRIHARTAERQDAGGGIADVRVVHLAERVRQGDPAPVAKIAAEHLPTMLRAGGPEREAASQELRDLLVRAALAYLARQSYPVEAFGADSYASVAEDFAHDALAIILRDLDRFRGESRF